MSNNMVKQKAKEAVKRMKSGFWDNYREKIDELRQIAKGEGVELSRVMDIFDKVNIKPKVVENQEEAFYAKVKNLLETEGEVFDAIGRLMDKEYYQTLDFESKQRYVLQISNMYQNAVERYKREKFIYKCN